MEKRLTVEDQNIQQTEKPAVNQPDQNPEKPKLHFWMTSSILLFIILVMGGAWFVLDTMFNTSSNQRVSRITNETTVTGVLRTSGLSEEEKQKYKLTAANYQITDFDTYQTVDQEGQTLGYFLLSNKVSDELLGKCVRVAGSVPEEWKHKNIASTYSRLALKATSIEIIDNSNCNPYVQTQPAIDNTQEVLVLRGTVVHAKRPAPDIGYDYQLQLKEPFIDTFSSAGSPQQESIVDVSPMTNYQWNELENNINNDVSIKGYMVWGYAESRYLQIESIIVKKSGDTFSLGKYKNCKVYSRSSMNIPSSDITLTDRSEVRCGFDGNQQDLVSVLDKPGFETAKNNVYRIWKDIEGYKVLIVDQIGAGSGEGNGKIILLQNNTHKLLSCFYYVPENFSGKHEDSLSDEEISKANELTLTSSNPHCNNFVLKSAI